MVFRFGPKKPTAFHLNLTRFDAFATSSDGNEFVLFENAKQAKWIHPLSSSRGLSSALREACRSFQDKGPIVHGWMEKCSIQVEDDVKISSLDESSDMLQNGLFRRWQRRYCWFFVSQEERYFYYANDRNGENPKGFLAMSRCSSVKTILGEHPEMILRCAMTRERVKIYRFRVVEDDDESDSDKKESSQLSTILPLTREWTRVFNGESRSMKVRRKTKKNSATSTGDGKFRAARRRKTPVQQQHRPPSAEKVVEKEKKTQGKNTNTTKKSSVSSESEIRKTRKHRQPKRTDSMSFRLIVKNWAKGKELIELIRDMSNILPPTSNGLRKTSERIETVASTFLSHGQCTTKELKKLYRLAVKYCHPDKWVQAQQGDVRAKIMCSEVFRMVQMRYDMMMRVFEESGETVYNIL